MTKTATTTISEFVGEVREWMKGRAAAAVVALHLKTEPNPSHRYGMNRKTGGYYPNKGYKKFRDDAGAQLAFEKLKRSEKPLLVLIEAVRTRPKRLTRQFPAGDVDNYAKGPLDALNGIAWDDDDQIVGVASFKRYAAIDEEPGVRMWWCEVELDGS